MNNEFMTAKEVYEWLRISESTFYRELKKGLPHINVAGSNRFIKEEVLEYYKNKKK